MYEKRIKIFVILIAILLLLCLLRMAQMQLLPDSSLQIDIAELKKGVSKQLKTVRGKILDRKGRVIATDVPQFQLCINYELSCFLDQRVCSAMLLIIENRKSKIENIEPSLSSLHKQLQAKIDDLQQLIDKCYILRAPARRHRSENC